MAHNVSSMNGKAKYEFIDGKMLDETCAEGRRSRRLRMNRNFHRSTDEAVNRLLNAMHRGSYIPVHRHLSPERSESCVVLRGRAGLTIYDGDGRVAARRIAGPDCDCKGFDLEAGVWHGLTVLEDDTVLFEVKQGPFAPISAEDIAPWSPAADDAEAIRDFVNEQENEFNKIEKL